MTTNEKFPVEIPACFIKDKYVDYDLELFAAVGASLPIGGFLVRAPSLGVFSLLETFESPFIASPKDCKLIDLWRVLYINEHRKSCMQEVMDWAYPSKGRLFNAEDTDTWVSFDWAVYAWGEELKLDEGIGGLEEPFVKIYEWFNVAFEGFDMIPAQGGGSGEMWFGAEAIGALSFSMGLSIDELLWEMPMCLVGHRMAACARSSGNDNVGRKKDVEDFKKQSREARARVREGKLHPWQLQDPGNPAWPLTQIQLEFAPSLKEEWEKLVEEKKNG